MYVVAQHQIQDAETAFERGERLQVGRGAPEGVRVLQFLPGTASINTCYEVAAEPAFAERPLGLATAPLLLR